MFIVGEGALEGLTSVAVTHQGQGNFQLFAYSPTDSGTLINELENYSGSVFLPNDTYMVQIVANSNGSWSVTKE